MERAVWRAADHGVAKRLLIFLLAVLIPACDSSSPAFHIVYSAYELNKQGDSRQPCHAVFPVLN